MTTGDLRVTRDGAVATVWLSNPGRRNTLTAGMWRRFAVVLAPLEDDDGVRAVVIRGEGEDFSAGADISDLRAILRNPENGMHDGGHVTAGEEAIAGFRKPVIAAVDGYCLGGAWQVAGACDFRIAWLVPVLPNTCCSAEILYPPSRRCAWDWWNGSSRRRISGPMSRPSPAASATVPSSRCRP